MLPFWLGEAERIMASASSPAPFGRVADDRLRLGIIGRDRTVPAGEVLDRFAIGHLAEHATQLGELLGMSVAAPG